MIRFLIFSLCCCSCFVACRSYQYPESSGIREADAQQLNTYFTDTAQTFVYRAKIQVFKSDLNGSLLIKTLAPDMHRVALVSDLGQTIFDVSLFADKDSVHYVMADLNRKRVLKEITDIFGTLTQVRHATTALMFLDKQHYPVYKVDDCYYLLKQRSVSCITKIKGAKEQFLINFNTVEKKVPTHILVEHKRLPITVDLALDSAQSIL